MKPEIKQAVQDIQQRKGALKAADLLEVGLGFRQIKRLVETNFLEKTGRGMYRISDQPYDERAEIARRIPNGVFCLFSACHFHDLTDFISSEQHLAVPKRARFVLPAYPPVKLYYWETGAYQIGMVEYDLDGVKIKIYDPEKTVCDICRLRNKVGLDILKEVIKKYLERPDRNLAQLHQYARQLRVEKTLNQYLQILL